MYHEKSRFVLVDRDYEVVEHYYGITDLARRTMDLIKVGHIGGHFKHERSGWYCPNEYIGEYGEPVRWWVKSRVEWIVLDENNNPVPINIIENIEYTKKPCLWYWPKWYTNKWTFRKDPVPSTGRGWRHGYISRQANYASELRQSFEYKGSIRPKRRLHLHLMSIDRRWDEYIRGSYRDKHSWKKNKKKKQWM